MLRPLQRNWPHFEQFRDKAPQTNPQIIPPPWSAQTKRLKTLEFRAKNWLSHNATAFWAQHISFIGVNLGMSSDLFDSCRFLNWKSHAKRGEERGVGKIEQTSSKSQLWSDHAV